MSTTLQQLQSDIQAYEAAAAPGSASEKLSGLIGRMVAILLADREPDTQPDNKTIDDLNASINRQAAILQATKTALGIPDSKTMAQMPEEAGKIYGEAQKWRNSL